MGNCIGKKTVADGKYPSLPAAPLLAVRPKKITSETQRARKSVPLVSFGKLASTSSSGGKDVGLVLNEEKTIERQLIEYVSSLNSTSRTSPASNEPLILQAAHSPPTTSSDYQIFHSSNALSNSASETSIQQPFEQSIHAQATTMGQFLSAENETNRENERGEDTLNSSDIKGRHCLDNDRIELNEQYLTIINDQQMSNASTMVKTHERRQGKRDMTTTTKKDHCLSPFQNHLTHLPHLHCSIRRSPRSPATQHHFHLKIDWFFARHLHRHRPLFCLQYLRRLLFLLDKHHAQIKFNLNQYPSTDHVR